MTQHMEKITRIAYNSENWEHPTGEAKKLEGSGSYNEVNGYGHEDWLFREEWEIDGWRYAFIQGIGHSHGKLVKQRQPFNLMLFTVLPDKRRRYVARIEAVECLDDEQAEHALTAFKKKGWFDLMKEEIRQINGDVDALGNAKWAKHVLNVRFQWASVQFFPNDSFVAADDPVQTLNRYVLVDRIRLREKFNAVAGRAGSVAFPSLASYARQGIGPVQVTPEHAAMQRILMEELRSEYPEGNVVREENFIDVQVKTLDELRLYEIKSDLCPRTVLRLAIGQLLEYSYFQIRSEGRNVVLVVVGRNPLSDQDKAYLAHLQGSVGLPLEYRVVHV